LLARQERAIENKNGEISQQLDTIEYQRLVLIAAVGFSALMIVLVALLLKAYREKTGINEKLASLAQSKDLFLSSMSHEIRTPLNGVSGMVEMLWDTPINSQQRQYLDTTQASGKVLIGVINDILDFSKIEANKMTVEYVDIERLLQDSSAMFRLRAANNVKFTVDIDSDVPRRIKSRPNTTPQNLGTPAINARSPENTSTYKELSFKECQVLLEEDNPTNQLVAKGLLKRYGIVPDVANNGYEAIACYQAKFREADKRGSDAAPYQIILMDCEMPEMDRIGGRDE